MTTHPRHDASATTTSTTAVAPDATRYTWDAVLAALGAPSAEDTALYAVAASPAAERAEGERIGSHRIYTDILRWSGEFADAWAAIPAAERDALHFDPAIVRVLAAHGAELRDLDARVQSASGTAAEHETANAATANAAFDASDRTRELLHSALASLARGDATLAARVETAYGTHGDAAALGRAVTALTTLARALLEHPHSRAAKRLARLKLTQARLDAFDAEARALGAAAGRVQGAKKHGGPVTQAMLDIKDGECLFLMTDVMHQLAAVHALDPRVPVVHPIATRGYFTRSRPHAPAPAGAPGDGAANPPVATGTGAGSTGVS